MYAQVVRTPPRLWHRGGKLKQSSAFAQCAKGCAFPDVQLDCIKYLKLGDPCVGSGHILVYAFDVLMQIYESAGYGQRDAARSILENNLYGLDIDDRAFQMAYFAIMMKARQYNRRILNGKYTPNLYSIQESSGINRNHLQYFGAGLNECEKKSAHIQMIGLLDTFKDSKEYGSILIVDQYDWKLLERFVSDTEMIEQINIYTVGVDETAEQLKQLIAPNRYQITITNPPYMGASNMSTRLSDYVRRNYLSEKADLFSVFITKCSRFTWKYGYYAMITQHGWMFLSSFEKFRAAHRKDEIINMAHLGARAFEEISGEVVQTVSFVSRPEGIKKYKGSYCRLITGMTQKEKEILFLSGKSRYFIAKEKFEVIPGSPIAYWMSNNYFKMFSGAKIYDVAPTRQGTATADNNTFLRLWNEVCFKNIAFGVDSQEASENNVKRWYPYNKGGSVRKWFGNRDYVIDWQYNGRRLKNFERAVIRNSSYYFMSGITWSDISTSGYSARYTENGFVFDSSGPMCFPQKKDMNYVLGILNSKITSSVLELLAPSFHYREGPVGNIPYLYKQPHAANVTAIVEENIFISKMDWDSSETSWDYLQHPITRGETKGRLIADKYTEWEKECDDRFNRLKENEEELNRIFIDIYGLQDELTPDIEDKDVTVRKADLQRDIKSFLSYSVGCMFGRYSLDFDGIAYAGGEWDSSKYISFQPDQDNVIPITDEEYLEDDIVSRLCSWLKVVYGEDTLEQNLDFIAFALGNKGDRSRGIIRNYFLNDFFKDHCQTYSVTGSGKRPIYWLFDSGKQNGFKALIYLHRYSTDTIGNLRIDYLHRMQRVYESEISRMQDMIDHSTNAREVGHATKRRDKLTKQLKECREYDEKLAHLALSRIELDLDDGVKVNYRKVQTAIDGKFYEVLADSKNIMTKVR